jgi:osmoprotectant transport system permease protein
MLAQAPSAWEWIWDHRDRILSLFLQHLLITTIAVAVGLAISLPLALFAYRHGRAYAPVTWITGLMYTIPSLALFALLTPFTGLTILTAEIGLVSYTLLILIRNIVAGLRSVPEDVKEAARGMGYTPRQLLRRVELPLAVPAIAAGVRVATVSTIGLVTVAALIGKGGLGQLITEGLRLLYTVEILTGALLSVALALLADGLLLWGERALTPWASAARRPRAT